MISSKITTIVLKLDPTRKHDTVHIKGDGSPDDNYVLYERS